MRCISCNDALTDYESTRKYVSTGIYLDLCLGCSGHVPDIKIDDRKDLRTFMAEDTVMENDDE